jgi:peptide/nickel transport system substrate-binding protein
VRLWLVLALTLACARAPDEGVKIVVPALPTTLDWSTSDPTSWVNFPVLLATQRGLTRLGPHNEIEPGLAKGWERAPTAEGHERYLFHLRDDVRWSDGATPLVAEDFVVAWRRALVGNERGEMGDLVGAQTVLRLLENGASEAEVEAAVAKVAVRAIDPHTLEVILDQPRGYFLARLANVYLFFPAPSRDLAGLTPEQARDYFERPAPGKPMSLGPYRVERWDRSGQRLTLALNRASAFLPALASGERLPEHVTMLRSEVGRALFDRGRVGFAFLDRPSALTTEKAATREPLLSTYFLAMMTDRSPLDRVEVRQAISAALDRRALLEGLLPAARVADGLLPPELPLSANASERVALPHFDPTRARALLAQAGGVKRRLRLVYHAGDSFIPEVAIAERIQAQLAKVGIAVDLEPRADFSSEIARRGSDGRHVVDLYLKRIGADYAHPHSFFMFFLHDGNHQTGWEAIDAGRPMARFEALLDRADASEDPGAARALYVEAERLLVGEEAILAPIYYPDRYFEAAPGLRGLGVDPFNFLSLSELREAAR